MKRALITGITGQDGSYLAEHLLEQGYEVHGIVRRHSVAENQSSRTAHIDHLIHRHYGDLSDEISLFEVIRQVEPDEIYNLAAMSHVRISFDMPAFTIKTNSLGALNMLEITKKLAPNARFYQASSSEMFGNNVDADGSQRLSTQMIPVSPYGISKVMSYNLTRHYRDAYKMFACNGILFNHESPRRGSNFVTSKVVKTAVEIAKGKANQLEMGNLDSSRDWGHSWDYVRAMHLIVNHHTARDWVVATGETHTVRDLCQVVFGMLKLNYLDYVVQNPKFMRPEELNYLRGDSSEIRSVLGWKPRYTFESMMEEMVRYWWDLI